MIVLLRGNWKKITKTNIWKQYLEHQTVDNTIKNKQEISNQKMSTIASKSSRNDVDSWLEKLRVDKEILEERDLRILCIKVKELLCEESTV